MLDWINEYIYSKYFYFTTLLLHKGLYIIYIKTYQTFVHLIESVRWPSMDILFRNVYTYSMSALSRQWCVCRLKEGLAGYPRFTYEAIFEGYAFLGRKKLAKTGEDYPKMFRNRKNLKIKNVDLQEIWIFFPKLYICKTENL